MILSQTIKRIALTHQRQHAACGRLLQLVIEHSTRQPSSTTRTIGHERSRWLSTQHNNDDDASFHSEEDSSRSNRHPGILTHPDSITSEILPGSQLMVERESGSSSKGTTTDKDAPEQKRKLSKLYSVDYIYGYFWMMKDLERAQDKPVLSNETLIPADEARVFPTLTGVETLRTNNNGKTTIPNDWLKQNRSQDPSAQCTLVAVSFRDYGYQLVTSSWMEPFQKQLASRKAVTDDDVDQNDQNDDAAKHTDDNRIQVVRLNVAEGYTVNFFLLRRVVQYLTRRNTPPEQHDTTFLYFAEDTLAELRDTLAMYNVLTGYVFLLDGLGRVRFAGSGPGSPEEIDRLVQMAQDLLVTPKRRTTSQAPNPFFPKRKGSRKKAPR